MNKALLTSCQLCPRKCGVNRLKDEIGYCKMPGQLRVARAALHMWEEPCISGYVDDTTVNIPGSGTVFFSGCTLRCVYCQNYDIAAGAYGKEITTSRLADIFLELQEQGAANINLVTPTHYTPWIIEALDLVKHRLNIPIISNTSGYETIDILKMFDGYIDIYLTDFKYFNSDIAKKYSKAEDYPYIAKIALEEMIKQTGTCQFSENGMITKGTIVRHLMLPGQLLDSKRIVRYLYESYGDRIYISLMNQYTPLPHVENYPELNCKVKSKSYDKLIDFAINLGIKNAFIQDGSAISESFIPSFECEGV